jgi:hypothetical protein
MQKASQQVLPEERLAGILPKVCAGRAETRPAVYRLELDAHIHSDDARFLCC